MLTRCFFVILAGVACLMPMQNDSFWHLRAGQEMWTRRAILLADPFSFTVPDAAWPNHEWLTELLFYAVYRLAGLPGLTLLCAAAVIGAVALAWSLMTGPTTTRVLLMGTAVVSAGAVWTVRPHVFTLLLLLVVVRLAVFRRYLWIPPLFVLWANLHGGVALGVVALGAIAAGRFLHTGVRAAAPMVVLTVLAFCATWATPLGPGLWLRIPESIHRSAVNRIVEWMPPGLSSTYVGFWALAIALAVTAWRCRRRIDEDVHASVLSVALALLPLALRARRNVAPFLMLAVPAISHNLHVFRRTRQEGSSKAERYGNVLVAAAAVCAIAVVATIWSRPPERLNWNPVPDRIARAIESCGDRVFNSYTDGGYLIWFTPSVKVFLDSRQDPYPIEFVQEYVAAEETGDYRGIFERYGIRCSALPKTSLIAARLKADGWQTLAEEGRWTVQRAPN
jgi:hypothetical protein